MVVLSFVGFLTLFLAVGLASVARATHSRTDYYLAGRAVPPWLTAISAVATNNSGYMFIGVIGYTYMQGLASIWLMFGWLFGDFLGSLIVHRRLRESSEQTGEASFTSAIARWNNQDYRLWRAVAAIIMLAFLGAYAAAQISAGGKALQSVLGWRPDLSAAAVAAMVLAYSAAGGIRASIWTDAAQSLVMLAAMSTLFVQALAARGGIGATLVEFAEIPGYLSLFPSDLLFPGALGMVLFVVGWIFAGFSVIGQPHIMVRFMALDDPTNLARTRIWYYGYFSLFYALATGVGMLSRLYLPELQAMDPELALPTMALELLSPLLVGMILAGIFAATMSTADSLVLSCSAALTHDLTLRRLDAGWQIKSATALVTVIALIIALLETRSVFQLVILAWSTLASAFGPLLVIYVMNRILSEGRAIATMCMGVATAIGWRALGWNDMVYEGLPGIVVGFGIGFALSRVKPLPGHRPVAAPAAGPRPQQAIPASVRPEA